jgi:hypothetical protein
MDFSYSYISGIGGQTQDLVRQMCSCLAVQQAEMEAAIAAYKAANVTLAARCSNHILVVQLAEVGAAAVQVAKIVAGKRTVSCPACPGHKPTNETK